ncbi:hypothetical protein [Streptomyces sp. NPDC002078]
MSARAVRCTTAPPWRCSCGWSVIVSSRLGARAMAKQHRREVTTGEAE